jgi:subtilisin family serine protease
LVAVAGNEGVAVDQEFPASLAEVITVATHSQNFEFCKWSNHGYPGCILYLTFSNAIDITAVGKRVWVVGKGGYKKKSGTSFASPMVAAAISKAMLKGHSQKAAREVCILLPSTLADQF